MRPSDHQVFYYIDTDEDGEITPEQLRGIVERFGRIGIAPADVFIVVQEPPLENWAIRGGVPACEVDLGFSLDV